MADPVPYKPVEEDSYPPSLYAPYTSTVTRAPRQPLVYIPQTLSETTGPVYGCSKLAVEDGDLTKQHPGEPLGERIVVSGRVLGDDDRPVPNALVEIWQCNASGRYRHHVDQHDAPLDPNFTGGGRVLTDAQGNYKFITIKPGAYPWRNHLNAWRPAHIHFSLLGPAFVTRLVTQMFFPGDPLLKFDPIFNSVPDEKARERMVCNFDIDTTVPQWALSYRHDIILRGRHATPMED